ncbi:fimbria/pilus outer membrane usher protein [Klebsiella oxytoca]|uniref:fimbria/pilus outer membrane usher protein n=1 Tax=Klebsiella oxytoca TaxID=571 RepID=UPI0020C49E14|nr:fimbria/pilus outer membrane usher protein [Klebsiella oxytoca]
MKIMNTYPFTVCKVAVVVSLVLSIGKSFALDFNTDVLDSIDRENIDFSRFSQAGYIMPGQYQMQILVNNQSISPSPYAIDFMEHTLSSDLHKPHQVATPAKPLPQPCLIPEMVERMGLLPSAKLKVTWWHDDQCADLSQLPGVVLHPDPAAGVLKINMPQAWLEYSDATWLPPSRWDKGIPGLLLDYNLNANVNKPYQGQQSQSVNYNGTVGLNVDAWRMRADYQGYLDHTSGSGQGTHSQSDWTRYYLYRAIPNWQAMLTVGESYINSDIFSTWRYTGVSLESDNRMLPPRLRGYAPQVSGVANTNARVVISQQGRILYDSTVPAGLFTIQDLDSSVRGTLDVKVVEQNGQTNTFQVTTAYVPYLTRPGQIRYKLVSGRSRNLQGHDTEGPFFAGGEASWGINNRWSLYGGGTLAGDYNTAAVGLGHDMNRLGTLSADVTQSVAKFNNGPGTLQGKSWRISYSKRFDDINADITFAGYRFSERNYMTMQQYLDARYRHDFTGREKELYTVTLNKNFDDAQTSVSLQYSYQTYWDQINENYYTFSLNRYFDAFGFRNIAAGITASRSQYNGRDNDIVFLRLSVPWGTGSMSYSGSLNNKRLTQTVGYSDVVNNGLDSYSLNTGVSSGGKGQRDGGQASAWYSHSSPLANVSMNAAAVQDSYTSFGMSLSGGATVTTKGAALHAGGLNGGTRLLVDTDGIAGVPVNGGRVLTNRWGIGVLTDVNSYYRNTTSVDLNRLPDDMEATRSVVESALTEGAIGYRQFEVLKGQRLFAVLSMSDGSHPPFGASVSNAKGRELGMVGDAGLAWLTGVNPGESLAVKWDAQSQCVVTIPPQLLPQSQLLLPCQKGDQ